MRDTIRIARASILLSFGIVLSCRGDEKGEPEPRDALRAAVDSLEVRGLRANCIPERSMVHLNEPPLNHFVPAIGCVRRLADTAFYHYQDTTGRVIAVGRRFQVKAEDMNWFTDSLYRGLVTQFGPAARCDIPEWLPTTRFFRWDAKGYGVELRNDTSNGFLRIPWVIVEAKAGDRLCGDSEGEPMIM